MKAALALGLATVCACPRTYAETAIAQLRNGDIYVRTDQGMAQLTHDGRNSGLATARDGSLVAFVRSEGINSDGDPMNSLWVCSVATGICRELVAPRVDQKPQENLVGINAPQFSYQAKALAGRGAVGSIFFATQAWATSRAVHRVTLSLPPKQSFVTDSNGFSVVPGGRFAGALDLCQHRYHPQGGSFDQHVILDPNTGRQLQRRSPDCD